MAQKAQKKSITKNMQQMLKDLETKHRIELDEFDKAQPSKSDASKSSA